MLTFKLPNTLMHVVIIPLLKCKSKDPADVNNYRPIAIATALQGTRASLAIATRQVPEDCGQPIWFQASIWDRNCHFCTKANSKFYSNQDIHVFMCFLDTKKAFDGVNN